MYSEPPTSTLMALPSILLILLLPEPTTSQLPNQASTTKPSCTSLSPAMSSADISLASFA